ncbi:MAG: CoA ligase [Ignavibacteria bacterium GWB2_35_12]|nr:MAG: CoA ligase [Ignavibacteria bacterium GWA2_35_8]OGU42448.1 MAG: CoA ligase [Ignavibacteria bacterium GWB2_35_12]OGU96617.1 MAG: CoA ligase [Ignavibacteria bacterium RIFOXYA2_FULL_35_10]OGV24228.1 MAG: CoA ligase [Ignavibacteria bacterium RIFOXYC2_FULL_35_21]
MIPKELIEPKSIVVVGGSNDLSKPGGRVIKNIVDGGYKGELFVVNPKETQVQGLACLKSVSELKEVDLAIIAISSKFIPETLEILINQVGCKSFIVLSAGFSEMGEEGKILEEKITDMVKKADGCLIGPNCMGVMTTSYKGLFGGPMPVLDTKGCDFVSGSGATAVFILETAIPMGIKFSSVFTVGNSALIGVEDIIQYWDETFDEKTSSRIKLIYVEQINEPQKFLKHCRSLIKKGCRIAAIKAGTTDAGSRAVSSHTGALAGSDLAVDALFRKAGVVRCSGRVELAYVAGIFNYPEFRGKRIAIVTHAGGPGVMLTDSLSKGGFDIPHIKGEDANELLSNLNYGSSVANPIDFIATGTAEQLGIILDYIDNKFDNIDGSVVIFGTPGLTDVTPVYELINEKMKICRKPILPVLPSIVQASDAIDTFISLGRVFFKDEVVLANAMSKVYNIPKPFEEVSKYKFDSNRISKLINENENGFLKPELVKELLDIAGIKRAKEYIATYEEQVLQACSKVGFPLVMKVIGPIHKTDVGGVILNISSDYEAVQSYKRLMKIQGASGVLIQPMLHSDFELFIGAKYEKDFGFIILCGVGGIFIEVLKDFTYGLCPINSDEALYMIRNLKSYQIFQGVRGKQKVDEHKYADIIVRLSALLEIAPEIKELDLNPLLIKDYEIVVADARILIEK